ncbi:hypothetical protein QJS04_geneDACA010510 [Acorus gramineus]|uniref:Uncharacterized protein n=1 Tax=Acorus gramineus TaxID=55184 RepID=A0AAV9AJK2_ACOGR|nr:hypothetical protein QJS04_geneDACA010510 [Acorus gramineus]
MPMPENEELGVGLRSLHASDHIAGMPIKKRWASWFQSQSPVNVKPSLLPGGNELPQDEPSISEPLSSVSDAGCSMPVSGTAVIAKGCSLEYRDAKSVVKDEPVSSVSDAGSSMSVIGAPIIVKGCSVEDRDVKTERKDEDYLGINHQEPVSSVVSRDREEITREMILSCNSNNNKLPPFSELQLALKEPSGPPVGEVSVEGKFTSSGKSAFRRVFGKNELSLAPNGILVMPTESQTGGVSHSEKLKSCDGHIGDVASVERHENVESKIDDTGIKFDIFHSCENRVNWDLNTTMETWDGSSCDVGSNVRSVGDANTDLGLNHRIPGDYNLGECDTTQINLVRHIPKETDNTSKLANCCSLSSDVFKLKNSLSLQLGPSETSLSLGFPCSSSEQGFASDLGSSMKSSLGSRNLNPAKFGSVKSEPMEDVVSCKKEFSRSDKRSSNTLDHVLVKSELPNGVDDICPARNQKFATKGCIKSEPLDIRVGTLEIGGGLTSQSDVSASNSEACNSRVVLREAGNKNEVVDTDPVPQSVTPDDNQSHADFSSGMNIEMPNSVDMSTLANGATQGTTDLISGSLVTSSKELNSFLNANETVGVYPVESVPSEPGEATILLPALDGGNSQLENALPMRGASHGDGEVNEDNIEEENDGNEHVSDELHDPDGAVLKPREANDDVYEDGEVREAPVEVACKNDQGVDMDLDDSFSHDSRENDNAGVKDATLQPENVKAENTDEPISDLCNEKNASVVGSVSCFKEVPSVEVPTSGSVKRTPTKTLHRVLPSAKDEGKKVPETESTSTGKNGVGMGQEILTTGVPGDTDGLGNNVGRSKDADKNMCLPKTESSVNDCNAKKQVNSCGRQSRVINTGQASDGSPSGIKKSILSRTVSSQTAKERCIDRTHRGERNGERRRDDSRRDEHRRSEKERNQDHLFCKPMTAGIRPDRPVFADDGMLLTASRSGRRLAIDEMQVLSRPPPRRHFSSYGRDGPMLDMQMIRRSPREILGPSGAPDMVILRHEENFLRGLPDDVVDHPFLHPQPQFERAEIAILGRERSHSPSGRRGLNLSSGCSRSSPSARTRSPHPWPSPRSPGRSPSGRVLQRNPRRFDPIELRERVGVEYVGPLRVNQFHEPPRDGDANMMRRHRGERHGPIGSFREFELAEDDELLRYRMERGPRPMYRPVIEGEVEFCERMPLRDVDRHVKNRLGEMPRRPRAMDEQEQSRFSGEGWDGVGPSGVGRLKRRRF